jgi:hypothetical protein
MNRAICLDACLEYMLAHLVKVDNGCDLTEHDSLVAAHQHTVFHMVAQAAR